MTDSFQIENLFFELVQITLGNRESFSRVPTGEERLMLLEMAQKQSLSSVLLEGMNKANLPAEPNVKKQMLEWIGQQYYTISMNTVQNQRAKELCDLFNEGGYKSCILKGQGTALYYERPDLRQCGDIDVWVTDGEGLMGNGSSRDRILEFSRKKGWKIGHIDIKHSDIEIFEDVPVEVHFLPSWMYCPTTNKRMLRFFETEAERQFGNYDGQVGFTHTTIDFDLVYSIVHIYRHIFSEGIGLRQLMDYYYILMHSTLELRQKAYKMLSRLRMRSFVGGIMWILCQKFGMDEAYALCDLNQRHGEFLLSEIITSGNFGQYDERTLRVDVNKKFERGFAQFGRNLRFVTYYPSEVLWSPFWKLWHWAWRKRKGYL